MTGRFIDFDAARAERDNEPILLRAYGEEFELPGAMPASVLLDVVRMYEERDAEDTLTAKDAVSLLRRMVPADVLDALLERDDFSTDDLTDLVGLVASAYTGGSGEAPAPNREARRKAMAKSTRSRGSTAGTTSPRAARAKSSPGRPSSKSGT